MAIIKLEKFGGELPSTSARSLPPTAARTAQNILSKTDDFKPLAGDTCVTPITPLVNQSPNSLYRMPRAVGGAIDTNYATMWVAPSSAMTDVHYAPGQIDDDLTSRTYATGAPTTPTGVSPFPYPVVFNNTGFTKRLGVPAPAKPTAVATVVNEYSTEEDNAARKSVPLAIYNAFKSAKQQFAAGSTAGLAAPTVSTLGWLKWDTAGVTDKDGGANGLPGKSYGEWNVLIPMTSGSGAYRLSTAYTEYAFLMMPGTIGREVIYGGNHYFAYPILLQGTGYTLDASAMATAVHAIPNPDPSIATPLIPTISATNLSNNAANYLLTSELPQKTSILAQDRANTALALSFGGSNAAAVAATVDAFFQKSNINTEINNAIAAFADDIITNVDDFYTLLPSVTTGTTVTAASIIALFPSNQSTSNALLFTSSTGVRTIDANAIKSAVYNLFPTAFSNENMDFVDQRKADAAMRQVVNKSLNDNLAPKLNTSYWSTAYPTEYPLTGTSSPTNTSTNREEQIKAAIETSIKAAKQVSADYDSVIAKMENIIKYDLFDTWIVIDVDVNLPKPVTRAIDTRYYVVTLVTDWGEESAPSPVSDKLEVDQNDYVTITKPSAFLDATTYPAFATECTNRHIVGWRLYRSNSGSQGAAFQLVTDKDATVALTGIDAQITDGSFDYFKLATGTGYKDQKKSSELQEVIATTSWVEPPANIQGMTGMANGVMAAYYDNTLCFCEPYVPYAWPIEYQLTTKYPINGIGAFGQSLFVSTMGNCYIVSGADSASMNMMEIPTPHTCVSPRSIVPLGIGVMYASPDGICMADNGGVKLLTEGIFSRNTWQGFNPSTIFAAQHDGIYFFIYQGGTPGSGSLPTGIPSSADPSGPGCYAFDFTTGKLVKVTFPFAALPTAFFEDKITDTLYAAITDSGNARAYALFTGGVNRTALYKTGIIKLPKQEPIAWAQIDSDFAADITLNWYGDGVLQPPSAAQTLLIKSYANLAAFPGTGVAGYYYVARDTLLAYVWLGGAYVKFGKAINPLRLPAGRFLEHEVEITTASNVTSVTLASSVQELQSV